MYSFLHLIMRFWMRIHFRRIFVRTLEHVPRKGPVLLACNHPNSFLDAVVVALILKRDIHFLVRSDVFRKPWANYLLRKLHMIPIYRLQEGVENLDRNNGTFQICNEILARGEVLLIFSEGNCVVEKRLRTLKKGTARIWFGAMEYTNWKSVIPVIPVGINYSHPYDFRGELMVSFGKAIDFTALKEAWSNENARAIKVFNEQLTSGMCKEMLLIPQHQLDKGVEVLLDLKRSLHVYPALKTWYFESERQAGEQNYLSQLYEFPEHDKLVNDAAQFGLALQKAGIQVRHFSRRVSVFNTWVLVIGFIPACLGFVLHILPLRLIRPIVRKTRKDPKFRSSVMFGAGALITYLFYLLITLGLMIFNWRFAAIILVLPWFSWIMLLWWEQLSIRRARTQEYVIGRKSKELLLKLELTRENLLMNSGAINLSPAANA